MKKLLILANILALLFVLWVAGSFVEINEQNKMPNPTYSQHNFFTMMEA